MTAAGYPGLRRILTGLCALTAFALPFGASHAGGGTHLFILSGQSNMAFMDPGISFTPVIASALGKENFTVVHDAHSGQPIHRWYRDWVSPAGQTAPHPGELYDQLMARVREAVADRPLESVTVIWMQGERDALNAWADTYAVALEGLFRQFRSDLGFEEINFVIGRINDFDMNNEQFPHWTRIRNIQELAAARSGRALVNTDDLNDIPIADGRAIVQDLHMTPAGYRELGRRFARVSLELLRRHHHPN